MTAVAFGFTKLVVSDLARSEQFYTRVFGLTARHGVTATDHAYALDEIMLSLDGPGAHVLALTRYRERPIPPAGAAWTGFVVTDVAAVLAELEAQGGRIEVATHENVEHGVLAALASDPDGHMIEIIEIIAQD